MKMKLLFFFVTAAVYPLLVGAVALIVRLINFSAGTDPAGAGMARGFTFIYSSIFVCIVWFILSIVLAQVYFRAWWIGLLGAGNGSHNLAGDLFRPELHPGSCAPFLHGIRCGR